MGELVMRKKRKMKKSTISCGKK